MTIASDEPEIVLGGDPPPSAPPMMATTVATPLLATPVMATAVATPLLAKRVSPAASAPATVTTSGAQIEKTTNADGSLSVKLTTTTPRPNGYREVRVEHFLVPEGTANAVRMALDAGTPPSSLHMTKMEQQVLPPGTGEAIGRAPSRPPSTSHFQPSPNDQAAYDAGGISGKQGCALCNFVVWCVAAIIVAAMKGEKSSQTSFPPPSPHFSPTRPTPFPAWQPTFGSQPSDPHDWNGPPFYGGSRSIPSPTLPSVRLTALVATFPPVAPGDSALNGGGVEDGGARRNDRARDDNMPTSSPLVKRSGTKSRKRSEV